MTVVMLAIMMMVIGVLAYHPQVLAHGGRGGDVE